MKFAYLIRYSCLRSAGSICALGKVMPKHTRTHTHSSHQPSICLFLNCNRILKTKGQEKLWGGSVKEKAIEMKELGWVFWVLLHFNFFVGKVEFLRWGAIISPNISVFCFYASTVGHLFLLQIFVFREYQTKPCYFILILISV